MNSLENFRIQSFLEYRIEKGVTSRYIDELRNALTEFKEECQRLKISMDKVTGNDAKGYQGDLVLQDLMPNTVNKRFTILRAYYNWLVKVGIIEVNPFIYVLPLKVKANIPDCISVDQVKDFFSDFDRTLSLKSIEQMAVFECLYGGGLSLVELCNLRVDDFLSETDSILIRSTSYRAERQVPLPSRSVATLRKYVTYRSIKFPHAKFLIVSKRGKQLSGRLVYTLITCLTSRRKAPRAIKNSYRAHLLQCGANLENVADLTRGTIASLIKFDLKSDPINLKSVHSRYHPKS